MSPLANLYPGVSWPLERARKRFLMNGLGRQSMVLMKLADMGMIGPKPDAMIVVDMGEAEREWARENLRLIQSPNFAPSFPVIVVSGGDLDGDFDAAIRGEKKRFSNPPLFIKNDDGTRGRITRGCTRDHKITRAVAEIKRQLGYVKGARMPQEPIVEQWLGFTRQEMHRVAAPPAPWIHNRCPLIEIDWTTEQGVEWFFQLTGIRLRNSGCFFCPFTGDHVWAAMKRENPAEFERACQRDEAARHSLPNVRQPAYLHDSLEPIRSIDFDARIAARQGGLLDWNEDEHHCPQGACGI